MVTDPTNLNPRFLRSLLMSVDNAFLAGKTLLGGNYSQYTPSGKGLLAQQGRIGKIPHFGDKVYFYSPKLKRVSHVGIVTSVSKNGERYDSGRQYKFNLF